MTWTRRAWMTRQARAAVGAWAAPALLGACASPPDAARDHIVDTTTGHTLTPAQVQGRLLDADFVLLGELHDNPHHHARRAALLVGIGAPAAVVAEHLPRGTQTRLPADASADHLRALLEASGFDAKGWRWPLHEPLFAAVAQAGQTLYGGNLDRDSARRLAREGAAAMPTSLAPLVAAAPLTAAALAALAQDLQRGHCGHLSHARTPGMVAAQRGRDAAMAEVLLAQQAHALATPGRRPPILLAGNGHVRRDYGVPTLLAAQRPGARILSVGFLEHAPERWSGPAPFDIVWATPPASRDDPCRAFPAARPASA